MPLAKKKAVCPYCRGTGFEIIQEYHPELYHDDGSGGKASPVDFAVPCRICKGRRQGFEKETQQRLELPYYYSMAAFNPHIYSEKDKTVDFAERYNFCMKYIENYREVEEELDIKGLYIYSPTAGNGKTFLASCICFEMYSRHQLMPIYVTENSLLDKLKATVSDAQASPREQFQTAPVLFIDDMWRKTTGREWVNDELFNIIDYRYTHKLPTIITSNVALNSKDIDVRIASRLNDMCMPIYMPDIEIRADKKKEKRQRAYDLLNGKEAKEEEE